MQTTIPGRAFRTLRHAPGIALLCVCLIVPASSGAETPGDPMALALDTARRHASATPTPVNRSEAIRAYREAARLGSAEARVELARMLLPLVDEPPDDMDLKWLYEIYPEALDGYREAARTGSAEVKHEFAVAFERHGGTARLEYLERLREAAELGHGRAQFDYAVKLLEGIDLARDDAAAAGWLERSAEQGYPDAQYLLGTLYQRGRGVVASAEIATRLYRLASHQGHPAAHAVLRTVAFLEAAPCRLDEMTPAAWRPIASRIGTLHVPPDASRTQVSDDDAEPLRITAPGITITLAPAADKPDAGELIVIGGDPLAVHFSGDGSEGAITLRWPLLALAGTSARLDIAYTAPASRDIACRIAGSARLLDPVSDLELVRIDADASPPRVLLRGERAERWAVVGDSVTRDHGRLTTIAHAQIEVIELIPAGGGRGWRERQVTMKPSSRRSD